MRIKFALTFMVVWSFFMLSTSCGAHRILSFAEKEWAISDYYGQIIDRDTTYRMTFGNILIPVELTVISSSDSVTKYPGMEKFISDILETTGLGDAEILFYTPEMATMFVVPRQTNPSIKPSSITSPMNGEAPYTMWLYDDIEDWKRTPQEMYTYTFFDKRKQLLLVVNHYDYGDLPIAQITVFQSANKTTSKMRVPISAYNGFFKHQLKNLEKDIEFWAHHVESVRNRAIANYKIGMEQLQRNK